MMVIARAPLRISLAGGGTDLPAYADRYGGLVVSTTIDRYVYVVLTQAGEDRLQITSADANSMFSRRDHLFDASLFWGADYRLPLQTLGHFGIERGCRLFIASEVPPGTGLGSSSATAVALITAVATFQGLSLTRQTVADLACHIEIDRMEMPIGRQDQYAAAFGGLNVFHFTSGETQVLPCRISEDTYQALEQHVLLFFTGLRRRSTDILRAQRTAIDEPNSQALHALHDIKAIAHDMIAALEAGDIEAVGSLLDESWERKRRLAQGVSSPVIDGWYDAAKRAGALGGKITGAGGGGFLLLCAPPERRRQLVQAMTELGLVWIDSQFEKQGAATVLSSGQPTLAAN